MSITIIDDYGHKMPSVEYVKNNYSVSEIERSLSKYKAWLFVAAIASFFASAMSVVKYMAGGSLDPFVWTTEQTLSAMTGLMVVAIVVAGETFAFSSGYRGKVMVFITAFFIFFGLFTEITQAMERENEGVSIRSQNSPAFQAAIKSVEQMSAQSSAPISNPYATQIADQAQVVAQCEQRVKEGRESHCNGDKAKLFSLQSQAQDQMTTSAQASSNAIVSALTTAKSWERDEDQHYGMIKLLKSWFDIEAITATFIFSFIIIATFRVAFLWVGDQVATYKQALEHLTGGKRVRPDTQDADNQADYSGGSNTQYAKKKAEPVKKYDLVPVAEIVRLSAIALLCDIADQKLESFAVRPVCGWLKDNGYGKTNSEREQEIYPSLLDHFIKEQYVTINGDWEEPKAGETNKNGKRQKWLIDLSKCQNAAQGIPRG